MRFFRPLALGLLVTAAGAISQSKEGIYDLVKRRLPNPVGNFEFSLVVDGDRDSHSNIPTNAEFVVTASEGKVRIEGNSLSALSSGYTIAFMELG